MIDHKLPKDWRDLQNKVAEILSDIGFKTEVAKEIETVRGKVEVDVFSVDETQSPSVKYLCECKHWNSRIPQNVVHAFRTVVQDYGANFGFIISKIGFQSGSYTTAQNTNIKLVSWYEFQDVFEDKWFPAITDRIYNSLERICSYTEPMYVSKKLDKLSKEELDVFKKLRSKYLFVGSVITHLKFGRIYDDDFWKRFNFPLNLPVPSDDPNDKKTLEVYSLREYVEFFNFWGTEGLREFNNLFKEI
jgi:restriction system protein